MRSVPAGNRTPAAPQAGSADSLACTSASGPLTYFIADEISMDAARDRSRQRLRQQVGRRKQQSGSHHIIDPADSSRRSSPIRGMESAYPSSESEQDVLHDASRPGTPLFVGLSSPGSLLSGTSSRRDSLVGSSSGARSSIAVTGVDEGCAGASEENAEASIVPQLIMPSMTLPRRRPFSETGKALGKLKVMVAGQSGLGKTSLIRSLAQRCEHIVHIDPVDGPSTTKMTEVYASSKPYPWWRTGLDSKTASRRRSSITEKLDRNICFAESPGRDEALTDSDAGLQYVQSQLSRTLGKSLDNDQLLALVEAGEEPIVDVLLYMIPPTGLEPADLWYMKKLQAVTNIIPIIARVDSLESETVGRAKEIVSNILAQEGVESFNFSHGPEPQTNLPRVYAISNMTQPDYEMMDASVLMGSQYSPPLIPTDLVDLADHIFTQDAAARLRHAAAVKCVKVRKERGHGHMQLSLRQQYHGMRNSHSSYLDRTPRPQRQYWDHINLVNWDSSLRDSLRTEQLYYTMAGKSTDSHLQSDGQVVSMKSSRRDVMRRRSRAFTHPKHQDPLGLLELGGRIRQNSRLLLELLSSIGLLGYMVTHLSRPKLTMGGCPTTAGGLRVLSMEAAGCWCL